MVVPRKSSSRIKDNELLLRKLVLSVVLRDGVDLPVLIGIPH